MHNATPGSGFLAQLRADLAAFEREEAEALRLAEEGRRSRSPEAVKIAVRAAVHARITQAQLRQTIRREEWVTLVRQAGAPESRSCTLAR
jgi:hypothetical protein